MSLMLRWIANKYKVFKTDGQQEKKNPAGYYLQYSLCLTALQWGIVSFVEQLTTRKSNEEVNRLKKRSIEIIFLLNNECRFIPVLSD